MTSSPMRSDLFERGVHGRVTEPVRGSGLDDPNWRGSFEEATSAG
jgi:hypothetical protein